MKNYKDYHYLYIGPYLTFNSNLNIKSEELYMLTDKYKDVILYTAETSLKIINDFDNFVDNTEKGIPNTWDTIKKSKVYTFQSSNPKYYKEIKNNTACFEITIDVSTSDDLYYSFYDELEKYLLNMDIFINRNYGIIGWPFKSTGYSEYEDVEEIMKRKYKNDKTN